MPGPKLLDKRMVNAELATARKEEIQKGIRLTKAIEALRETLAEEERKLEIFRTETVRAVRLEIDSLIRERDQLIKSNLELYGRN